MTTNAVLSPSPVQKFFSNNGTPLSGGLVYTYAGGSSTPIATYTDSTAGTPNANPIVLNARGEAAIWLTPNVSYKYVVTDSLGNTISTTDQITVAQLLTLWGGTDKGLAANGYLLSFTSSYSGYEDGMIIYFIPSHNNTGASTINVNGFGAVNIVNVDGSLLGTNQIVAGVITEIIFYQTSFQLLSVAQLSGTTIGTFGTAANFASGTTTDLGASGSHVINVTGTATITSFGTSASTLAPIYALNFTAGITLTYNATHLIIPGNASIVTSLGDAALAQYLGSGNWEILLYQSALPQYGSFTATLTGPASPPTQTMYYRINGTPGGSYVVTLYVNAALTGTFSSGSMTVTGIPAALRPTVNRSVNTIIEQNSVSATPAMATISTAGVISFLYLNSGVYNGVIAAGTIALTADWNITYPI